jgi:DtxR family Mn-dependent transcriptional regulator
MAGEVTAASPDGTVTLNIEGGHVGIGPFAASRILVSLPVAAAALA